jgi:hypothetical protein
MRKIRKILKRKEVKRNTPKIKKENNIIISIIAFNYIS